MKKETSKTEAKRQIEDFFKNLPGKNPEDVKKIKKLAMSRGIKLGDKRKLFCKKCLTPLLNSSIGIKNGFVNVECSSCGEKSRWRLNNREIDFRFHGHYGESCC